MKRIKEELNRVRNLVQSIGDEIFIRSNDFRDDREWWVLGETVGILEEKGLDYPSLAIKTKPTEPDFITFIDNHERFKPIEITEVLRPGRKRGDEYKAKISTESVKPNEDPWSSFRTVLNDKFQKKYDEDCWLIVYHNVLYFKDITAYGYWHNTILANAELWNETNNGGSCNLHQCPYEKILVLNSSANSLVSIFPELKVIQPEKTPY